MPSWITQLLQVFQTLRQIAPYMRFRRRTLALLLGVLMLASLLEGIGIGLLIPLLSLLTGDIAHAGGAITLLQGWFPGGSRSFYLLTCALLVVGSIAFKNWFIVIAARMTAAASRRATINLREAMYERLAIAELGFFDRTAAGAIARLMMEEVPRAVSTLTASVQVFQQMAMTLVYIAGLIIISWKLGSIVLVLGVLLGSAIAFLYRTLRQGGHDYTSLSMLLSARLSETFAGVRAVRAANAQRAEQRRFQDLNARQSRAEEQNVSGHATIQPLVETLAVLGGMLVVAAAYRWLVLPGNLSSAALLAFGVLLLRIIPLLSRIYSSQGYLVYASEGVRVINTWLELPSEPTRPFGSSPMPPLERALSVRELTFAYGVGRPALDALTLDIEAGQFVAIVGRSGSGKSTLAAMLMRMRAPSSGTVLVDGVDYWSISADEWHGSVALVEQDAFLFNDTFAANVAYGLEDVSRAELESAVRKAHLDDVVQELPQGYDTVLGERGATLSGGQRQRLAIARALVRNPRVLILDEATSHLDTVSERIVQAALEEAAAGRTTIVIAHRLSTVRNADRIVVMEDGRVVEQGTWDELERKQGAFAALLSHGVLVEALAE